MYAIFELLFVIGVAIVGLALLWTLLRLLRSPRRLSAPLLMMILGIGIACVPVVYTRFISQVDLGEREKIVEGERHLTLSGWDRDDYRFLRFKEDTVVLQMANPDVTDQTLELLENMSQLQELDLDNTQITDNGLKILSRLKTLQRLRLGATSISDQGFNDYLLDLPNLKRLNLQNTNVSDETIENWRQLQPGRRAMK